MNIEDNVYVININERRDRWQHIQDTFNDKLNLIRIEAIVNEFGWIGCYQSHIKCLKIAKELNLDYIIVMEDDCIPCDINTFHFRFNDIINFLKCNKEWDIFLGASSGTSDNTNIKILDDYNIPNEKLIYVDEAAGTQFIIYNKKVYDLIINAEMKYPIDRMWYKQLNKQAIVPIPFLAIQKNCYSNICNKNVNYDKLFNKSKLLLEKKID